MGLPLHSKTADNAGEMLDCIWNMEYGIWNMDIDMDMTICE